MQDAEDIRAEVVEQIAILEQSEETPNQDHMENGSKETAVNISKEEINGTDEPEATGDHEVPPELEVVYNQEEVEDQGDVAAEKQQLIQKIIEIMDNEGLDIEEEDENRDMTADEVRNPEGGAITSVQSNRKESLKLGIVQDCQSKDCPDCAKKSKGGAGNH